MSILSLLPDALMDRTPDKTTHRLTGAIEDEIPLTEDENLSARLYFRHAGGLHGSWTIAVRDPGSGNFIGKGYALDPTRQNISATTALCLLLERAAAFLGGVIKTAERLINRRAGRVSSHRDDRDPDTAKAVRDAVAAMVPWLFGDFLANYSDDTCGLDQIVDIANEIVEMTEI